MMIPGTYISMLILGYGIQSIYGDLCKSGENLSKLSGEIYYSTKNKDEYCTWSFIPPHYGYDDLLIVKFFSLKNYDEGHDTITLPDGNSQQVAEELSIKDDSICGSYLLDNDKNHNCTNEFAKQFCETELNDDIIIHPNITSFHEKSRKELQFFTYLFVDCPEKSFADPTTQSSISITTSMQIDDTTTRSNNDMKTIIDNQTTVHEETTSGPTETTEEDETIQCSQESQNPRPLIVGMAVLAVLLALSCSLLAIVAIRYLQERRTNNSPRDNLSTKKSKLVGQSNSSFCFENINSLEPKTETKLTIENVLYGSFKKENSEEMIPDATNSLKLENSNKMIENVLFGSCPKKYSEENNSENTYSLILPKQKKSVFENGSHAKDSSEETISKDNCSSVQQQEGNNMVENVLYGSCAKDSSK